MKKRLVTGLVILGAASMLCGFDSAETAESVMQKMQEASSAAEGTTMDMNMNVDVAVNIGDGQTTSTLPVKVTADYAGTVSMDPLATQMDMNMNLSALGQGQNMKMKLYGVTNENGEFETYVYTEDAATGESGWSYDAAKGLNITELMDMSKSFDYSTMADWGLTYELAPEAADFNGTECYLLTTTLDASTLSTVLDKVALLSGQDITSDENVAMVLSMLDGLKLNIQYYVDAATYLPVNMHMDMAGSDLTTINAMIQALVAGTDESGSTTTEVVLNDVSIDAATTYGAVAPIEVPQEALDAVASGAAQSLGDLAGEAENAAENVVE